MILTLKKLFSSPSRAANSIHLDCWQKDTNEYSKLVDESPEFFSSTYYQILVKTILRLAKKYTKEGDFVLDAGCGEGYFAREVAKLNRNVAGCDVSKQLLSLAQKKSPQISYWFEDFERKTTTAKKVTCDFVFSNLVLMYIKNIDNYLLSLTRYLKHGKVAVITIPHPCFNQENNKEWFSSAKNSSLIIKNYLEETVFEKNIGARFSTYHFHRTLETYIQKFAEHGLQILEILEPQAMKNFTPLLTKASRVPFYMVFVLQKK